MLCIRNWPFVPYVPVLALCVYMYHNGKLNESVYVRSCDHKSTVHESWSGYKCNGNECV